MNFDEAAIHFETDKGTTQKRGGPGHGYSLVYARELARFGVPEDGLAGIFADMAAQHRRPVLLEVGVQAGCSMRMWDYVLPADWKIVGVEVALLPGIRDAIEKTIESPDRVFIVEGDSTSFSDTQVIAGRHGPFDVIVDDGDHYPRSQENTLVNFWPHLRVGGIYCIEDLHESFWDAVHEHPQPRGSLLPCLHGLIEQCLGRGRFATWGPVPPMPAPEKSDSAIRSIRFYRNMVVLEKGQ